MYGSAPGKNEDQVVVFGLHDQLYGVSIASTLEIIRVESETKVPGSPDFIEGIINLRGRVIPVMDLCKRFGLPDSGVSERSRVIIVESGGVTLGVKVDFVSEVMRLPSSGIEPLPNVFAGTGSNALSGVAMVGDRLIILVDMEKLLIDVERQELLELGQ
ncbi:MAG: chemotaxis protein CheW [Bacillota bacterium]